MRGMARDRDPSKPKPKVGAVITKQRKEIEDESVPLWRMEGRRMGLVEVAGSKDVEKRNVGRVELVVGEAQGSQRVGW